GRHDDAGRIRPVDRRREEELVHRIREGRPGRQEADRRGACDQVTSDARAGASPRAPAIVNLNPPTRDTAFDRFARGVRALSTLCGFVAAGLVALAVVIVCEMVFVRYVLNRSTIWQTDFITYCITAATFIGSPYVLLTRGHVNVNVLPLHLSPRRRYVLALFASIV